MLVSLLPGCDGAAPTDVAGPWASTSGVDETTFVEESPPTIDFDILRFEGPGSAGYFQMSVDLDAVGILAPPEAPSSDVQLPTDLQILSFFEEDGGKGETIDGDGAIHNSSTGVFARGGFEEVSVSGTLTHEDENGAEVVERVEGVLTVDLEGQVEEPAKGDFFRECGDACLQFDISASLEWVEGPAPCLITGTFTVGIPQQPS